MIRTQVSLTDDQMARLRRESARTGKSIAQLTREAIDRSYPSDDWEDRVRRIMALAGKYSSGSGDVSENHDAIWADDIWERKGRPAR